MRAKQTKNVSAEAAISGFLDIRRRDGDRRRRPGGGVSPQSKDQPVASAITRCPARSKRSGKTYQGPAVKGWGVCRMHGAGGRAPKGNKNALKHGRYTAKSIALRRAIRELLRESRELVRAI
jgi:hypothetical protein